MALSLFDLNNNKATKDVATISTDGLMSADDKVKLNSIAANANNYVLPVASTILGGIKSGTDITVDTNGNVTVNNADTVDDIQGADLVKKDGSIAMNNLTIGTRTGTVGSNSFAQGGNTTASGANSHAEGYGTTASADYSHAEGYYATASGYNSHAEGTNTTASGSRSHAQNIYTIAQGYAQTAIGRYNIAQGTNPSTFTATDDAFIIGNGTSASAKSNAFKVSFDGKAWTQEGYYVGASNNAVYHEGNLPTSFPANGGNADTVDGKHASDFSTKDGTTERLFNINMNSDEGYCYLQKNSSPTLDYGTYLVDRQNETNGGLKTTLILKNGGAVLAKANYEGVQEWAGKVWHENNDGHGTGLDADTVDGIHGENFCRKYYMGGRQRTQRIFSVAKTSTNVKYYFDVVDGGISQGVKSPLQILFGHNGEQGSKIEVYRTGSLPSYKLRFVVYDDGTYLNGYFVSDIYVDNWTIIEKHNNNVTIDIVNVGTNTHVPTGTKIFDSDTDSITVWTSETDGTGSGLDADTVDGIQGADLVKKDGSIAMNKLTVGTRTGTVGTNSSARGFNCEASGSYSHAEGLSSTASGNYSHSESKDTTASGVSSHAEGYLTIASGEVSHSEGSGSKAIGSHSHAQNTYTSAQGYSQTAIGRHNKLQGTSTSFTATSDAFIVGNGTSTSAKSNAFRVTFDGKAYGLSAYNSSGADYAEYFEWEDGNPDCEDRVGYFVTLDGEKIRKANSTDDYILGVVSANATVVGDTASENWNGKYSTDEFGRIQYEYVDVPAVLDDEGNEIEPARQDYVMKINPEWDSSQEYIPREERPEWSIVGMMGKLTVRDDGTCQVNGYCKSDNDGIATSSENGYRVMKRVSENIIQILVK